MAENSQIEWTDHTFNPWMGCTKVSDGCKNCYAETLMDKRHNKVKWGPKGARIRTSESYWKQPIKWNREAEAKGERARVFCASLADVFEGPETMPKESWPVVMEARSDLFKLIEQTPWLDWQILTKRPDHAWKWYGPNMDWMPNIWIGTSVEDQKSADERIPHLLACPAAVRFLSCEPLLGPVDLNESLCEFTAGFPYWDGDTDYREKVLRQAIHWVICGGESGPGKRPFDCDWGRSLRDQCKAAGVPFFMKQVDKVRPIPDDLMIREFPACGSRTCASEGVG